MPEKILCSVLVASYNHENYIEDTLESLYHQTYRHIELLVCDDCSTDHSWDRIQEYLADKKDRFTDVKLVRHEQNKGLVEGLLEMLELSTGEIIKVMAGDDIFGETYFEDVVQAYLANPQDTVFLTNSYLIGENDHFNDLKENQYEIFYKEAPDFEQETLFRRMYQGNLIFGTGMAAPREVHLKYGTFSRNNIVEDWELWLKWSSTGKVRFQYIDKPDVYYRKSAGSMTSLVKNETMAKRWFALFDACENIIDKYGTYFSKEEYAKRKWEYFLYEGGMMRAYQFGDEKELLRGKVKAFLKENGKYLPLIYHIRYYRMRLRGTMVLP